MLYAYNHSNIIILLLDISDIHKKERSISDLLGLLIDIKYEWKKIGWALEVGHGVLGSCTHNNEDDGNRLSTVIES